MDFDYVVVPATLLIAAITLLGISIRYLRGLSSRPRVKLARMLDLTILVAGNVLIVGVAVSSCINAIQIERFRAKNPEPGTDYLVNGKKMHINCTGAGSPTIVLDS